MITPPRSAAAESFMHPRTLLLTLAVAIATMGGCSGDGAAVRTTRIDASPITFVALGDNRGAADGTLPPVFLELLDSLSLLRPAFAVNTGDLIFGMRGATEAQLRVMWTRYLDAVRRLPMRTLHAPGNHDVFDPVSARLWREMLGPKHYAFDTAAIRVIVLDSESESGRIGDEQFKWLRGQLATLEGRTAFVIVHRPLFPFDPHVGSSLDRFFAERDRLHSLFVEHRDRIGAVISGHEHLVDDQSIDGVRYLITGGAGAPLYVPPELGGIHHFLVVTHDPARDTTIVSVRALSDHRQPATAAGGDTIRLSDFAASHLFTAWDPSVGIRSTTADATDGRRAMHLSFDAGRYRWPTLEVRLDSALDARLGDTLVVDVVAPADIAGRAAASLVYDSDAGERAGALMPLRPGRNRLALAIGDADRRARHGALATVVLELSEGAGRGSVVIDALRSTRRGTTTMHESFEHPVFWSSWNDSVIVERVKPQPLLPAWGLQLTSTRSSRRGAHVMARLDPPLALSETDVLVMEITQNQIDPPNELMVYVGSRGHRMAVARVGLLPGTVRARIPLTMIPASIRAQLESIDLFFPQVLERQTVNVSDVRIIRGAAQ